MSGILFNSSNEAFARLSRVRYFLAISLAFFSPIPLITIANKNFSRELCFYFSIESSKLSTLFGPNPSSSISSSLRSFKL